MNTTPEFAPVSVPAQIAVLLALTADLFDDVPLAQMKDAEEAVRRAAADISSAVSERLDSGDKLTNEDRKTIIDIARKALVEFLPSLNSKSDAELGGES